MVQLTNTRRSDGVPDPDGTLKEVDRIKIRHCRNVYLNRQDPIAFIPLAVDTAGRLYDEFIRLLFLNVHREVSTSANEFPEECGSQSPWTSHLGLSYLFLVSLVHVSFNSFPRTCSSVFCLSGTC